MKITNANFNEFVVGKPIDVGGFEIAIDFGNVIGDFVQSGFSRSGGGALNRESGVGVVPFHIGKTTQMPIKNLFEQDHGHMIVLEDVQEFDFIGETGWQGLKQRSINWGNFGEALTKCNIIVNEGCVCVISRFVCDRVVMNRQCGSTRGEVFVGRIIVGEFII